MSEFEYEEPETVLEAMAGELEVEPEDLDIDEETGWRNVGTIYQLTLGRKEWMVAESLEEAEALAREMVVDRIEESPETFDQSFLEQHINIDRLRSDLESDVESMNLDQLTDEAERDPEDFWLTAARYGIEPEGPEEGDEDWEWPEPDSEVVEDVARRMTEEQLKDPMAYLDDLYGDEAIKRAIEIAGIDVGAAAQDAVDTDGAETYLASYDGNLHDGPEGMVYWRVH